MKQGPHPLLSGQGGVEKLATGPRSLLNGQGKVEKLATGKSTSTKRKKTIEKVKIAKHTNRGDMERTDPMGNWKTRVAQKRNEEVQIRYSRYLRSTLDRER